MRVSRYKERLLKIPIIRRLLFAKCSHSTSSRQAQIVFSHMLFDELQIPIGRGEPQVAIHPALIVGSVRFVRLVDNRVDRRTLAETDHKIFFVLLRPVQQGATYRKRTSFIQ